jgi:hypothetical protein
MESILTISSSIEYIGDQLDDLASVCDERSGPEMRGSLRRLRDRLRQINRQIKLEGRYLSDSPLLSPHE